MLQEENRKKGKRRMKKQPAFVFIHPDSSKIKKIHISIPKIIIGLIITILIIVGSLKLSVNLIIKLSHNSRIAQLQKKNSILEHQLKQMTDQITALREKINNIEQIDDELRAQLDVPPIAEDVRKVGIGGSDVSQYSNIKLDDPELESLLAQNQSVLARLEREIKLEEESFKELLTTMERKEDSLRFLPAIKPVPNARLTDGFGKRRHPILKRIMPHHGIDLAANRGTPILAAADGYVTFTGRNGGYGLFVVIDHKYGFKTKYGHLQKIYVRRGQFVKRGDKIGEVGNTGLSTAPHLHYEVHYRGKPVNPTQFYFNDIVFE